MAKAFNAKEALRKARWRIAMYDKYGGPKGVSDHYRELKKRSMAHPNNQRGTHKGGFSDPEVARKAGEKSYRGKAKPKENKHGKEMA